MSDTPETDANSPARYAIIGPDGVRTDYVPADFARKLERERDELRQKNKTLAQCWRDAEQERDEFRMRLESSK